MTDYNRMINKLREAAEMIDEAIDKAEDNRTELTYLSSDFNDAIACLDKLVTAKNADKEDLILRAVDGELTEADIHTIREAIGAGNN